MADWKETIFAWCGTINLDDNDNFFAGDDPMDWKFKIPYEGSWLPSASAAEADDPLHSSAPWLKPPHSLPPTDNPNKFSLKGTLLAHSPNFLVMEMKGGYKLDNGDGHSEYKDKHQTLVIQRDGYRISDGGELDL